MHSLSKEAIAARACTLLGKIATARAASALAADSVSLVAAGKSQDIQAIRAAIEAGITDFGENRVQEAAEKWPALKKQYPHVKLHLIGPLQTNKVKEALALFDVIETVDRERLVEVVAGCWSLVAGGKTGLTSNQKPATRNFLIQINTGEEPQKSGVFPAKADALIAYAKAKGLNVTGLMCVPPAGENPGPHFALLHEIARRNALPFLSMGMSSDFETAIRFGATHVRIGTALFGAR